MLGTVTASLALPSSQKERGQEPQEPGLRAQTEAPESVLEALGTGTCYRNDKEKETLREARTPPRPGPVARGDGQEREKQPLQRRGPGGEQGSNRCLGHLGTYNLLGAPHVVR